MAGMKILTISTDNDILTEGSWTRERMIWYAGLFEEYHILLVTKAAGEETSFGNVRVYPMNFRRAIGWRPNFKVDLVSAQDPFENGLIGWRLAGKLNVSLHLQIHTDFLSHFFRNKSLKNKIRVAMSRFLLPRASQIRVVSERIKKSLLDAFKLPESKITVLPIFIDVQKIKSAPVEINLREKYPEFNFIILMASRLTEEKNIPMATGVMGAIVKMFPKTLLFIAGKGPEEENIKYQIAKYKLENNVKIEEWTNNIISYYKTADLFLLTSNYEGYGRTIVEAMAAGCPVLMTDVGLAGSIVRSGYNGAVIPVGDKKSLEREMTNMIMDRSTRINLAVSAEKTIAVFPNKDEYLEQMKKMYEKTLNYHSGL